MQLSASTWPLLQRLQRQFQQQQQQPSAAPVTLLAQLVHGSSTTRGRLAVELTAAGGAATQQLAATQVQLHFGAAPPLDEAAAAKLGGGLEVAASRAPSAAGLANLLAARMWCQADGSGGLALQGLAATPAPIIDFKPLLDKRVVSQPLPNRLAAGLLRSPPAAAPALEVRQAGIAGFFFCALSHPPRGIPPDIAWPLYRSPAPAGWFPHHGQCQIAGATVCR